MLDIPVTGKSSYNNIIVKLIERRLAKDFQLQNELFIAM
jgi:hypothetical protein